MSETRFKTGDEVNYRNTMMSAVGCKVRLGPDANERYAIETPGGILILAPADDLKPAPQPKPVRVAVNVCVLDLKKLRAGGDVRATLFPENNLNAKGGKASS